MNIWEAYCRPDYYNIYFDTLVAAGTSSETAIKLKRQFCNYIQRIKGTRYATVLKGCSTKDEFADVLHELFNDKWQDRIKYQDMPSHYEYYLDFLNSIQAVYNDFIDDNEKNNLIVSDPEMPIHELSPYETKYLKNGKLVFLMNPQLLSTLREYIEEDKFTPVKAAMICEMFYEGLLPDMENEDFVELINYWWKRNDKTKKGRKRNQIKVIFPDGHEITDSTTEAMKEVVEFYGPENVMKRRLKIRNEDFVVKYVPMGKENLYELLSNGYGIYNSGNIKDRLNALRAINIGLGNKLKIDVI